jgi:hypothetical protein
MPGQLTKRTLRFTVRHAIDFSDSDGATAYGFVDGELQLALLLQLWIAEAYRPTRDPVTPGGVYIYSPNWFPKFCRRRRKMPVRIARSHH